MSFRPIPRRTFLRGVGALLPLPLLECMAPPAAAAKAPGPPPRFLWLYQGCGFYPEHWNPQGEGAAFRLPRTLRPFEPFRDRMTVIRNLTTTADGPHIGKASALLTGVQARLDPALGVYTCGKSVDQHLAEAIGGDTLIPSLQLGVESPAQGVCSGADIPVSYGATLSWSGPATRLMSEIRPRSVFDRLFRRHAGPDARERARWQGSILDAVKEQAAGIERQGSSQDRQKIGEYLESVRAVERRLQRVLQPPGRAWTPPTRPPDARLAPPAPGVPPDREEHLRLMGDLVALAFWTDSTRVVSFLLTNELSDATFSFLPGVDRTFHNGASHHQNRPELIEQYARINEFHARVAARILQSLDAIDEGGRSLLENSLVFFGSSLKDGHAHSNVDLPIAMFGSLGGRVRPRGQVLCREGTNIVDLHRTTLQWYGVRTQEFNGLRADLLPGIG